MVLVRQQANWLLLSLVLLTGATALQPPSLAAVLETTSAPSISQSDLVPETAAQQPPSSQPATAAESKQHHRAHEAAQSSSTVAAQEGQDASAPGPCEDVGTAKARQEPDFSAHKMQWPHTNSRDWWSKVLGPSEAELHASGYHEYNNRRLWVNDFVGLITFGAGSCLALVRELITPGQPFRSVQCKGIAIARFHCNQGLDIG